jgi:pimeloyl-ACP methyl ester carboxylesterase
MAKRRRQGSASSAGAYLAARVPFGPRPDAEHVEFTLELGAQTVPAVSSAATVANLTYDVRDAIGAIDVPSLVIRGSADRLSTARSTAQLGNSLADPTVVVIAGVGHLPMLEARHEFNELIASFVRSTGSPSAVVER